MEGFFKIYLEVIKWQIQFRDRVGRHRARQDTDVSTSILSLERRWERVPLPIP